MLQLPIDIDRNSPVPLYHQLATQLTEAIESSTLKPGDLFENELALADRLELSRPTVRRAISELVAKGLLIRRRGIGTTVANKVVHRRNELTSLYDDLQRSGRTPVTKILDFDPARIDAGAAGHLGVGVDVPLIFIERLRSADGTPLAVMRNWLPPKYEQITAELLETNGLYALLRQYGARPVVAHQSIGARSPKAAERRVLGLGRGEPVLTMTREAYDAEGTPIEFGDHCYRADQYAFDITVYES